VLHFVYDLDTYLNADRGLYYSLDKVAGGAVVRELDDLLRHLDDNLADPMLDSERRKTLRQWMLGLDDSRSSERFAADIPARA
jgi:CDP-glycerol glycerophosphotransferase (TagB/SpsB family)